MMRAVGLPPWAGGWKGWNFHSAEVERKMGADCGLSEAGVAWCSSHLWVCAWAILASPLFTLLIQSGFEVGQMCSEGSARVNPLLLMGIQY